MKFKIKKKTKKKIYKVLVNTFVIVLTLAVIGLGYFAYYTIPQLDKIETYKFDDKFFWAEYFYVDNVKKLDESPGAVIVSDKAEDLAETASMLKSISKKFLPERIFIVSQIENSSTVSDIYVCNKCRFYDVKGQVDVDRDFAKELSSSEIVVASDDIFKSQNSAIRVMPLVSHFFPESTITPILISQNAKKENLSRLKNIINEKNDKDFLIISPVSFSDDTVSVLNEVDNISSKRSIQNFDYENISDLSVSSTDSLYAFLSMMNVFSFNKVNFENKSVLFYPGEIEKNIGTTVLLFGNVSKEVDFNVIRSFTYDKNYNYKSDLTPFRQLKDIRGKSDSFLVGTDNLFFDSENNDCANFTQNDFKISFCKFGQDLSDENLEVLKDEKENSDAVFVLLDYNNKEFDDEKKIVAKKLVDNGADVVIGRGIIDVLPIEFYKNSAIVYSLGDFLPEAKLFTELNSNLKGAVMAINIDKTSLTGYVLPVNVLAGFPVLGTEEEKSSIFKTIISELNLSSGKFEIDSREAKFKLPR